ncbi:phosphatase PAP2 family protein [Nocardia terpenica]|uniref:Phosphatidic acid phosphatase type 2/haloperoxidase domain-containing protein n=1 Tax=Nocardia terpenica TaxID=455432 RepID=A0A291RJL9_9NOCA|nr:phosphatase PAP2 family protein [Nocardia terpenica]ATL67567.1 hypothetical protein CRH09_16530 [Nocardia terpenica]
MNRPLVLTPRRVAASATVAIGVLVTVLLPLSFPAGGGPTGFDRAIGDRIHRALDAHPGVYRALVIPSNAYVLIPLLAIGVLWYAWRRQWWRAGFLLVVPELVVAVNTWALKPLWHRHLQHYLAYPSGHTVQFVAIAAAFVLVATTLRVRVIEITVAAVVFAGVAVGMIGLGYHYPTDIVGGIATAVAAVLVASAVCAVVGSRRPNQPGP